MFGGRGRFIGSNARVASMGLGNGYGGMERRPGAIGDDIEVVETPVPKVPKHPFLRAGLHIVEPIETHYSGEALERVLLTNLQLVVTSIWQTI